MLAALNLQDMTFSMKKIRDFLRKLSSKIVYTNLIGIETGSKQGLRDLSLRWIGNGLCSRKIPLQRNSNLIIFLIDSFNFGLWDNYLDLVLSVTLDINLYNLVYWLFQIVRFSLYPLYYQIYNIYQYFKKKSYEISRNHMKLKNFLAIKKCFL